MRSCSLLMLLTIPLFAQTGPIIPFLQATNAATRTASIAPGSYVAIYYNPTPYLSLPNGVFTLTTSEGATLSLTSVIPPTATDPTNTNELWLPIPANAGSRIRDHHPQA